MPSHRHLEFHRREMWSRVPQQFFFSLPSHFFALPFKFHSGRGFNWAPVGPSWTHGRENLQVPVPHGTAWVRHWARCICECMNKSLSFFSSSFSLPYLQYTILPQRPATGRVCTRSAKLYTLDGWGRKETERIGRQMIRFLCVR